MGTMVDNSYISRLNTEEVSTRPGISQLQKQLKRFEKDNQTHAEDTLRKQNTGLDQLVNIKLTPDLQTLMESGEARILGDHDSKEVRTTIIDERQPDPVYGQELPPFVYKLHSVEVHQYVDVGDNSQTKPPREVSARTTGTGVSSEWVGAEKTGPRAQIISQIEPSSAVSQPIIQIENPVSKPPSEPEPTSSNNDQKPHA